MSEIKKENAAPERGLIDSSIFDDGKAKARSEANCFQTALRNGRVNLTNVIREVNQICVKNSLSKWLVSRCALAH